MRTKATIEVQYFNRRKMNFEPLVEPWTFMVKYDRKNLDTKLEVGNWKPPKD